MHRLILALVFAAAVGTLSVGTTYAAGSRVTDCQAAAAAIKKQIDSVSGSAAIKRVLVKADMDADEAEALAAKGKDAAKAAVDAHCAG